MVQPEFFEGEVALSESELEDQILNYYQTILDIQIVSALDGSSIR